MVAHKGVIVAHERIVVAHERVMVAQGSGSGSLSE